MVERDSSRPSCRRSRSRRAARRRNRRSGHRPSRRRSVPAAARRRPARWRRTARRCGFPPDRSHRPAQDIQVSPVIAPGIRIASPGPGNGWRPTKLSGRPSSRPRSRTSSLNSSRKGSTSCMFMRSGRPPDIVVRFDGDAGPAGERYDSMTSGIQRALCQKICAAEFSGFFLEHVDEQPPMILRFVSGSVTPASAPKNSSRRSGAPAEYCSDRGTVRRPRPPRSSHQAVVDKHAGQLVADGFVQ